MFQEIVTYLIITLAVFIAVIKTIKQLGRKKQKTAVKFRNETCTSEHNCSTCSDECVFRNTVSSEMKQKGKVI